MKDENIMVCFDGVPIKGHREAEIVDIKGGRSIVHSKRLPPGTEIVNLSVPPLRPMLTVRWISPAPAVFDPHRTHTDGSFYRLVESKEALAEFLGCDVEEIEGFEVLLYGTKWVLR